MAQPEIIDKPIRWRRIGWYSLAVVVLTLIGPYAFAFWRYEQQRAAIAEIERFGGDVRTEKGGLEWLREIVGDERMKIFDRVVYVNLVLAEITDGSSKHLSVLTNLEELMLAGTEITDDALVISPIQYNNIATSLANTVMANCDQAACSAGLSF